jgi:hypothetical protein
MRSNLFAHSRHRQVGEPEVEGEEGPTWAEIGGGVGRRHASEPQNDGSVGWPDWCAAIDGKGARPDEFEKGDAPGSFGGVLTEKLLCPRYAAGSEFRDGDEAKA